MNPIRFAVSCLAALVSLGVSMPSGADDIDIYSGNPSSDVPNILFILDNAANFVSGAGPCTYSAAAGGGAPTLNNTAGGVQQCALVNAIASLPDTGTVNIGLMSYNENNFTSGAAAGVGPCIGSDGGCLLRPLTLMNVAGKAALMGFVKGWKTSGQSNAASFNIKAAGKKTGSAMQEAWAYYNGKIGMSGKNYATPIVSAGCQKNFIIFVGNAFNPSGTPGDPNPGPENNNTGLQSADVGATAAQTAKLTDTIIFPAATCGVTSIVAASNASDWSENWADEWARFMYQQDASTNHQGTQNITTYTIGVIDPASCKPDYPALLTNMAKHGGGKYYQTVNAEDLRNAVLNILNEVQAVNSVFASASLPVSVNGQGAYLNQIFMGLFRPEETAKPRWAGNLKQYKLIADVNGNLSLGDALGQSALSSSGRGFLSPNAISYWTCSNTNNPYLTTTLTAAQSALLPACPSINDPLGGFWKNFPTLAASAGGPYDLPDGELVEKGGVGQQIRLAYRDVTAPTYTASGGPRKLYTYCPSGASCASNLTDSTNAFTAGNAGITAAMVGASTSTDKATLINWVRGQDNFGDETGPGTDGGTSITIRPSVHGDVLHSRPMVINYGGTTGVVVFYGDNGGVFRAINGNQVNPGGSTLPAPGNELWGFIPVESFGKLNRQRINAPSLLLPVTPAGILPAPQKKDYFIDGPTGIYQVLNASGATTKAILYLTMRRGGNFLYAVDVTDPVVPKVLWKKDTSSLSELGQTWSTPKVFRVRGRTNPVVAFAAGYDTAQDAEPPTTADSKGRGIYVLDAVSGDLVWRATYGATTACTTTGTISVTAGSRTCTDSMMKFSIPSDLTLVDRDRDRYIDRMYVGDLGGNVWRVDLEPSTTSKLADTWQVNRIASLGCFSAECPFPAITSPRKIFFPPEIISTGTYDAVFVVTGDREHPLDRDTGGQRVNRLFMLQDKHTGNDVLASPPQALIRPTDLYDATDCSAPGPTFISPCSSQVTPKVPYSGQSPGYSIRLGNGEKGVNAPLVVAGSVYFGTNLPKPVNAALCTSNLGEARGYRLFPFTAAYGFTVFESEGLPPSPVAGVVRVNVPYLKADGTYGTNAKNVPFAIGIGSGHTTPGTTTPLDPSTAPCVGADCKSAFGGQKPPISMPTTRTKNYWYTEGK